MKDVSTPITTEIAKRRRKPKADLKFNPWLEPRGELDAMAQRIAEDFIRWRDKKLYADDRLKLQTTVAAIVCNLQRSATMYDGGRVGIFVGKDNEGRGMLRYACKSVPTHILRDILADAEKRPVWFTFLPGHRGRASSLRPTAKFKRALQRASQTPEYVHENPDQEFIILKCGDNRVPYDDNETTNAMRGEVGKINAFLAKSDVAFIQDGLEYVNTSDRIVKRYFSLFEGQSPQFDQGGRLLGRAFWLNLERERRRPGLRIDGEMIAEVDLNAAFTRFAMALCEVQLDDSDPYDLGDDLAPYRSGIKQAVNALFFSDGMLKRWPEDIAAELPKGLTVKRLVARIPKRLQQLEQFFGTRMGFAFMFTESQIAVRTMLRLIDAGITALPLHDAMLVARSRAERVKDVLEEVAQDVTGYRIPASIKLPIVE